MDVVVVFVVVAVVIGLLGWYQAQASRQRTSDLSQLALQRDLQFHALGSAADAWMRAPALQTGRNNSLHNLMKGMIGGLAVVAFDRHYTIGTGKGRRHKQETIVQVSVRTPQNPTIRLPRFSLRAESWLDAVGEALLGMQDINYSDSPEFSKRYHLSGDAGTRELFSREVRQEIGQVGKPLTIDSCGSELTFPRGSELIPAADLELHIRNCVALAERLSQST